MKHKRSLVTGVALTLALALGGSSAWAGEDLVWYNKNIPGTGGSGVTASQTKTTTGTAGYVKSNSVSGSSKMRARMEGASNYTWTSYVISENTTHYLYNSALAGSSVQMRLQSSVGSLGTINAQGSWRSN